MLFNSEQNLEAGEVVQDSPHQQGDDGSGGLCRHPNQPGQPVLGEPSTHSHVPRVDKQHCPSLLAGLKVHYENGDERHVRKITIYTVLMYCTGCPRQIEHFDLHKTHLKCQVSLDVISSLYSGGWAIFYDVSYFALMDLLLPNVTHFSKKQL